MPNYNLTIDSTFQPFSFERYIQPYAIYGETYSQQENAITELSTKSEEFAALAESERLRNGDNSETYKRYSKYAKDLKEQADSLATKGLNIKTRSSVLDLKRRYSSEIDPIEKMNIKLQGMQDARRKLEMSNPTIRYERDYNEVGVDELLKDSNFDYGKSYSGALVEEQVSKAAAALSKNMREDPKGWHKILGNQYYQRKIQMGYTPEEVLLAAVGDSKAPKELQKIANDALASSGIESWGGYYDNNGNITDKGKSILNEFRGFVGRGLNSAVGSTQYERLSNKDYNTASSNGGDINKTTSEDKTKKNPYLNAAIPEDARNKATQYKKAFGEKGQLPIEKYTKSTYGFNILGGEPLVNGMYQPYMRQNSTQVNPIKVYEDYLEYSKEQPANKTYIMGTPGGYGGGMIQGDTRDFRKMYEKENGVSLLTKQEYDLLKELGYTANSPIEDFANLPQKIDESIKLESPVSFNLSDYNRERDLLTGLINSTNIGSTIYEYTGSGELGKGVEYNDLFSINDDGKASFKNDISHMGVDPLNKDFIIMTTGGHTYSVKATTLFPEMEGIIDTIFEVVKFATPEEKDNLMQALSVAYQRAANGYDPRRSETSSNATYAYNIYQE